MENNPTAHIAHDPAVAFSIGSFSVHTYALTMTFGIIFSILSIIFFWLRRKYSFEVLELLIIIVVPSAIIGARIWYVLGNISDPNVRANWYAIWQGGLAIQGAVTFGTLSGLIVLYFNRHNIDWMDALGIIMPNVLIGQVIGRWGNFANHEVFGLITSRESVSWLGSWIADNMYINANGVSAYRVPLFFYESMTSLVGYILIVWVIQLFIPQKVKPGTPAALYLLWYGIVRISMEPLRDPSDIMKWGSMSVSVFYSALYIIAGIGLLLWFQFFTKRYIYIKERKKWVWKINLAKESYTKEVALVKNVKE